MGSFKLKIILKLRQLVYIGVSTIFLALLITLCVLIFSPYKADFIPSWWKLPMFSPENLYSAALGMHNEYDPRSVEAAKMLAKHPDAEPWIVLLIVSSQTTKEGSRHTVALGLVAVVLKNLPENVDSSVLWSMTYLLDEKKEGVWPEEPGFIIARRVSCSSKPIRELTRDILKARLGVDHGWNAKAWQKTILNRTKDGNVNLKPERNTHSQPPK